MRVEIIEDLNKKIVLYLKTLKISSLNFKNNLRGSAVLSLIHGKEMILKNEVKTF